MLIINTTTDFLKDLTCGCGKPATLAWHKPVEKPKPQKMSKTEVKHTVTQEPQPYGWCCDRHEPQGIR